MATLIKSYKIKRFCDYKEIENVGSTDGLELFEVETRTISCPYVKIKTWTDNYGNGFETREYRGLIS